MDGEKWNFEKRRLIQRLNALAAPVETQMALYPDFVEIADELVLDFDEIYRIVVAECNDSLAFHQEDRLAVLDAYIESVSGGGFPSVWTQEGLAESAEWRQIRTLAISALASFGIQPGAPKFSNSIYLRQKQE